jgi:DNA-binding transcriptional LysR family regulator
MERAAASLEMEIAGHDKAASGVVKISAPDGVGGFWVAPHIPEFLRANPDIDLVLDCALWLDRPFDGEIDVALTFTRPEQEELIAHPIAYYHYVLLAARSHLDLYGMPKTRQEALAHPYVHHIAQVHQRDEKAAAYQLTAHHRLTTNSSAVSFNAVREGAGIHPLPTAALALDPNLVIVDDAHHGPITMWLVQRREMARSARVKKVVAWLEEVFDQNTQPWYREEYVPPSEFQDELKRYVAKRRGLSVEPVAPTPLRERA